MKPAHHSSPLTPHRASRRSRLYRCTSTSRGACANARTAISIRTRRARRCPSSSYVDALIARPRIGAAVDLGAQGLHDFFRRRHAERVFGRRHRAHHRSGARARAAVGRCRDHARSEPRHVRGGEIPRTSARRASTACRSASRVSIRAISRRSAASTTTSKRARRSRSRAIISTTSISISCTGCRGKALTKRAPTSRPRLRSRRRTCRRIT